MFRSFFRNLENNCPKEALVGDKVLDDYIIALDRELYGRSKARLPVLLEVRDHLEEKKNALIRTGVPPARASERAVHDFGAFSSLAQEQRQSVIRVFRSWALFMGLWFAIWSYVVDPQKNMTSLLTCLVSGLFVGVFMGLIEAVKGRMPQTAPANDFSSREYVVSGFPRGRGILLSATLLLGALGVAGLGYAVSGFGPMEYLFRTRAGGVLVGIASLVLAARFYPGFTVISVDGEGFTVRSPHGRKSIKWTSVTGFSTLESEKSWLALLPGWKRTPVLSYKTDSGKKEYVMLSSDMENFGRFVSDAEKFTAMDASSKE